MWATDVSDDALAVARANVAGLRGDARADRRRRASGSIRCPPTLRGALRLVVSNPPYVAEHEVAELPDEVAAYEPRRALVSGPSGTEAIETLLERRAGVARARRSVRVRDRAAPGRRDARARACDSATTR